MLIVLTFVAIWLSIDAVLGYGLRHLYYRSYPKYYLDQTSIPSMIERIWVRFRVFLKDALEQHYLVSGSHRRLIQPDGTFQSTTVFDPHYGWRWATSRRVYLDPIQRTLKRPPPDKGLFTDRNGIIPNSTGFDINLANKLSGQYRIFLLGGSSLAGIASRTNSTGNCIDNDGTIAAVLERNLNETSESTAFQIINAGVHGYASVEEFLYYSLELVHFPHDMVISFHGYNDANLAIYQHISLDVDSPGSLLANHPNLNNRIVEVTSRIRSQEQNSLLRLAVSLVRQVLGGLTTVLVVSFCLHMLKSVTGRHRVKVNESGKAKDESSTLQSTADNSGTSMVRTHKLSQDMLRRIDEYAERMVANDLHLGSIAASEGKVFLSILQPILVSKHALTEEEIIHNPSRETAAGYLAFIEAARRHFRGLTDDSTVLGPRFIDFSSLLDSSERRLYSDIIHYSDEGIDIISNSITEIVSEMLLEESKKELEK